jgi:hypothetical protein
MGLIHLITKSIVIFKFKSDKYNFIDLLQDFLLFFLKEAKRAKQNALKQKVIIYKNLSNIDIHRKKQNHYMQ